MKAENQQDVTETTSVLVDQAKLVASDGAASDYFGWSVSLSEDGQTVLATTTIKAVTVVLPISPANQNH